MLEQVIMKSVNGILLYKITIYINLMMIRNN
jgi:hypothetical protein